MAALIQVAFPHMVLNSHNVPPPDYKMLVTQKVPEAEPLSAMISLVAEKARGRKEKRLATLIFNSHGSPGSIHIGHGIRLADVASFYALHGLVDQIWIVACRVAGQHDNVSGAINGTQFCQDLADASGAAVTAGIKAQKTNMAEIPYGHIDEWEGKVFTFNPAKP